jgi:hypothetical protein
MEVDRVLPNLLVGSCPAGKEDIERLKRQFGVTAVLNVQTDEDFAHWGIDFAGLEAWYGACGVKIRRLPVRDFDPDELRWKLPECVELLDQLLRQGHTVYLHCSAGVNRSPSVAIAYLCWIGGWTFEAATGHVMACRPCDPYLESIRLASEDRGQDK